MIFERLGLHIYTRSSMPPFVLCRVLQMWGSDVRAFTPPDVPSIQDLLRAFIELSSVATFLDSRRLASPPLTLSLQRIKRFGAVEESMPVCEMRESVTTLATEMRAHMDPDAVVALRIFVQNGGKQGSRMFTVRFDAKSKALMSSPQEQHTSVLGVASDCALAVASEMEALVSDESARISLFR